jgi:flagellar basal body-associated protein FliL
VKLPNWALPLLVIAFVAIRIYVASLFRKAERKKSGKGQSRGIPIWIKVFWVLLLIAVVTLLIWNPRRPVPAAPNPAPTPATPPAAKDPDHP